MSFSSQLSGSIEATLRGDRNCVSVDTPIINLGVGAGRYVREFEDGALTGGNLLIVEHGLGVIPASVMVFASNGEEIEPDRIGYLSVSTIFVDLESFRPLVGSYTLIVRS
jgi:hypothetical protein